MRVSTILLSFVLVLLVVGLFGDPFSPASGDSNQAASLEQLTDHALHGRSSAPAPSPLGAVNPELPPVHSFLHIAR